MRQLLSVGGDGLKMRRRTLGNALSGCSRLPRRGDASRADEGIPIVSLFCGAGGLDLGFEWAGFQTLLAVDSSPAAVESYNKNARVPVAVCADIAKLDARKLTTLLRAHSRKRPRGVIGGPPCQGFSSGNVVSKSVDPRNRLPFAYARLIGQLNQISPIDFFVFENVTGLCRPKHAARWARIKAAFRRAGFQLFEREIDALHFGLPQIRRRIFLVGLNERIHRNVQFQFPVGCQESCRTVADAIAGFPEPALFKRGLLPKDIPFHPNHWTMNPRSKRFETGRFNRYRSFRRLLWEQPSPTVAYGNREIHIHPDGRRRLSIFEAMLIQGFPKTYVLTGTLSEQVTQISNAVPPPVAYALAHSVRDAVFQASFSESSSRGIEVSCAGDSIPKPKLQFEQALALNELGGTV